MASYSIRSRDLLRDFKLNDWSSESISLRSDTSAADSADELEPLNSHSAENSDEVIRGSSDTYVEDAVVASKDPLDSDESEEEVVERQIHFTFGALGTKTFAYVEGKRYFPVKKGTLLIKISNGQVYWSDIQTVSFKKFVDPFNWVKGVEVDGGYDDVTFEYIR